LRSTSTFAGKLLRLLEQALGLHRRLDRIEHDANRGGELFEEHGLQRREFVDRSKLDHGLDLVLEQNRQHDGVARRQPEQRRGNRDGVLRHVGDQHAALVDRALPDQAFAEPQR
jgi:hypothetical protein